jgi:rSAM/selenodomain-associated transferase 1
MPNQSKLENVAMESRSLKNKSLLIIFYRNPELGKVKTRLAAQIGDAKAFSIYLLLADHTRRITEKLPVHKVLFYSDHIDKKDNWSNRKYKKHVQAGKDLGDKMMNSFEAGFTSVYKSICIIGSDCLELTEKIIEDAFLKLKTHDTVIGPARDGGYYLLGLNKLYPQLFQNKNWSTDTVLSSTLDDFKTLGLDFWQLKTLNDVDEEKDLPADFR